MRRFGWLTAAALLGLGFVCLAKAAEDEKARSVEEIAAQVRKSVVVIEGTGRDGKRQGIGSGFVVAADGLIATNLHVIGEARPVTVRFADGKRHDVTVIHASDRHRDLALVRIDAKGLPALELGDSDTLVQGQDVVAVGNPQGLEHSVVAGVVSGRRDIEGQSMIQVAVPIEPGNSGGPLLDRQGRVHGLLTLKSLVTDNLGFAAPINDLKDLLKKPNPVPMTRWLTIGALDPAEWQPLFGARWRQRAGRITVDGTGTGFGGRSVCLWQQPAPKVPFEAEVSVRLDDEAGAAGLVFHADDGDRHYGFYPTNGSFRLTRFDGPDVLSWRILEQKRSSHYRAGDWNTLRVRLDKGKIQCFVNDQLLIESDDTGLTEGKLGLAKFRDTKAEFRRFQVGEKLPPSSPPAEVAARIGKTAERVPVEGGLPTDVIDTLAPDGAVAVQALRDRARALELQAARMRLLALAVQHKRVLDELTKLCQGKDEAIDLVRAALLVARLDNDEIDVDAYRREVERMAREISQTLPKEADDKARLEALNKFFFTTRGFHGSRGDYYHRSNSYLNEVIDDREGLPITLSLLYAELGQRIGLKLEGVGLPGHFVVRHVPAQGEPRLLDVYDGGKEMTREEAEKTIRAATGGKLREEFLKPAAKKAIIVRIIQNLMNLARRDRDAGALLRYADVVVTLAPDSTEDRLLRAILRYNTGQRKEALTDVDWLLEHEPEGLDREKVLELRKAITRPEP